MPTETVYGLAADAGNDAAVAQIFALKGRPADHPLIVHVASAQAAEHYASLVPDFARALMATFWPGPLTLILPRRAGVASAAAGGNPTIGLRCPAHPVALALLRQLGEKNQPGCHSATTLADICWGLAAPSANPFGRVSPTTALHVQQEFGCDLLVLDGGPCSVGIESTIIDCSRGQPVLLRPGAITPARIEAACGLRVLQKDELSSQAAPAPKASGTLESHYAPRARVRLLAATALQAALDEMAATGGNAARASPPGPVPRAAPALAVWARTAGLAPADRVLCQHMPADAASAARQLFAVLRDFDTLGVGEIWIETPPDSPDWDGVRDRLQRAAR